MKKLNYLFAKIFKAILEKLIRMYTETQFKSITYLLQQCINDETHNKISVSTNSVLNKLIYEIELTTCSFNQIIELVNNTVSLRIENMNVKLNSDNDSFFKEVQTYYNKLSVIELKIKGLFLILIK